MLGCLTTLLQGLNFSLAARIAFKPNSAHTVWASVARAVRTPSRIDVDYYIPTFPVPDTQPSVAGGPSFVSEKVIAYETGYKTQPFEKLSLSIATFCNKYYDLYSVEVLPGKLTYQIQNGVEGYSLGAEFSGSYRMSDVWRLRGGYTYFHKKIDNKPGRVYDYSDLGNDPRHQCLLQSVLNLPKGFQLDLIMRYVGMLPKPYIADYFTFDLRMAWQYKQLEFAVAGQNLAQKDHLEGPLTRIPRSIYGRLTWRI